MIDTGLLTITWLSLKVAIVAVVISLPFGIGVAYLLARGRFWGRGLLSGLVHLPLVLPPVVTGYLLLLSLGPASTFGQFLETIFGQGLAFEWQGAALAAAVMGFPLMVRSIWLSIEAVDRRLEDTAAILGAGPWTVFRTLTLPLIMPGIIAGTVLAFAKAVGEFGATITFAANIPGETQTIPGAIYAALQMPGGGSKVVTLVVISVGLAILSLAVAEWVSRRVARRIAP